MLWLEYFCCLRSDIYCSVHVVKIDLTRLNRINSSSSGFRLAPFHAYALQLDLNKNFNNKKTHTSMKTHPHPQNCTYIYICTNSKISVTNPNSIHLFSVPAAITTHFNYKQRTKLVRNRKSITDSRFRYNIFTNKPYACTPLKCFITIDDSSLHIPSGLTSTAENYNSHRPMVFAFIYLYLFTFISQKWFTQTLP